MKSVAFQRIEVADQMLFLSAEHLSVLSVLHCKIFITVKSQERTLSYLYCVDRGTFNCENKRDHLISKNHKVEVNTAARDPRKRLHSLSLGITKKRGFSTYLVSYSFEVPHQMLREREDGVDTIDTPAPLLQLRQLHLMPLLPGWHSNSNGHGQQCAQRLDPTRRIGRQPPVLHPVSDRANQQPEQAAHGKKYAEENYSLLYKPFFRDTHFGEHLLKGNQPSLPTAASLVYGRAA